MLLERLQFYKMRQITVISIGNYKFSWQKIDKFGKRLLILISHSKNIDFYKVLNFKNYCKNATFYLNH